MKTTLGKIAGAAAIINENKEILLLQRSFASKRAPGKWTFPAGGIEPEDESVEHCVIREVKEETNLDFHVTGKFNFYDFISNNKRYYSLVHLGTYSGELKIDNESEDAKFFSYNETQNLEIAFAYKTVLDDLYNAGLIV
ncbi:NUDIX hydrolase [Patescibacteria group bacterium]|nr:NUDIX hydrolase [Patescibacteria group bacterium]